MTVALDVTIDEELKNEGIARELVNRIQNLRKDSGLEVTDKIELKIQKNEDFGKSDCAERKLFEERDFSCFFSRGRPTSRRG